MSAVRADLDSHHHRPAHIGTGEDWAQPSNPAQDGPEQSWRNSHLGHLKPDIPCLDHHLGPSLHPLLPQRRQQPVFDAVASRQPAKESRPSCMPRPTVVVKPGCPPSRGMRAESISPPSVAFLDLLLRPAAPVVELSLPLHRSDSG